MALIENNRWQDEISYFKRMIALNKNSNFNYLAFANLAKVYEKYNKMPEAEHYYKLAAENSGNDPYFYDALGLFYLKNKDFSRAKAVLLYSLKLNPKSSSTNFLLSLVDKFTAN